MDTQIAVMAIIVEYRESVEKLNDILHGYADLIIGRMGIPYRARDINVISIALDASGDAIAELADKVDKLAGVNVETVISKV